MRKVTKLFKKSSYSFIKRINDVVFSIFSLFFLLPLFIIIAILIKTDSKGSVFFLHERLGINGKKIKIWKFRTMTTNINAIINSYSKKEMEEYRKNFKLINNVGITRVGKILRETNLDELPQFINILIGDLSFVGPRPVVKVEVGKYGKNKTKFLSIKPGLTGYWVANRDENTSYEERMNMELYYINNVCFLLDVKIFLKTIALSIKNLCFTRKKNEK